MAQISVWRVLLGLAAAGTLAACVETSGPVGGGEASPGGAGVKLRTGDEVEAPDVFQANEAALWDGRPSLGGIWVASPDAVDPERVVMFNPATGKTVKGALFRRERDNPGPRLQLSSDAAEALGVIAGMPTEIQVTALRKVEDPAPSEEPAAEETPSDEALAAPAEGATEAAAVAAAALDAVDAGTEAATGAVPTPGDETAAPTEEAAKPKTRKEKREEAKAAREAKKAAEEAASAPVEGEAAATPEAVVVTEIESAPLDGDQPDPAKGTDAAAEAGSSAGEDPAPQDQPEAASGGAARTIQIASFSKEDNAKRAIEALSKIGIEARSTKIEKDGKIYWSVVASGDASLLQKIKDAGFADAYFLK